MDVAIGGVEVASVMTESEYAVYRWDDGAMTFERRLFIKHEAGEVVTAERVREQVEHEVYDFKPARYRAVPVNRWVDFTVHGRVELP